MLAQEILLENKILQILIADDQYLIALEAERILTESCACSVSICRADHLEEEVEAHDYDVIMVDAAPTPAQCASQAHVVQRSGAILVFLWADQVMAEELASLNPAAVFEKPFLETLMQDFVRTIQSPAA